MSDKPIGRVSRPQRRSGNTDWAEIDARSDEQITSQMRSDPDWAEDLDIDWTKAEFSPPIRKAPISIRLDEDVVRFFKAQGPGYQSRINAVLRHYVREVQRSGALRRR
jgi:uncharacterized protein (DUF4415 family)